MRVTTTPTSNTPRSNSAYATHTGRGTEKSLASVSDPQQETYTSKHSAGHPTVSSIPRTKSEKPSIIVLVHPSSLSINPSLTGVRAALRDEFSDIYVINLRGDATKSGDEWEIEGDKVFGQHSRNGVQVTILVHDPHRLGPNRAALHYAEVPPYLKLDEKFQWLSELGDISSKQFDEVPVNDNHDWVNVGDESFSELPMPMCQSASESDATSAIRLHARGIATSCDTYVYGFSKSAVLQNVKRLIRAYEDALSRHVEDGNSVEEVTRNDDLSAIKWTAALKQTLRRKERIRFEPERIRKVLYRPFVSLWLYDDDRILSQSKAAAAIFSEREDPGSRLHSDSDHERPTVALWVLQFGPNF